MTGSGPALGSREALRIVYVVESLGLSGGVKVIVEHAEGLAERGHEVSIVTKDAQHEWIPIGVPVQEVPVFDARTLPPADVHIATWFPTVLPTLRATRSKRVFHFCQGYEGQYPFVAHRLPEIEEAYAQSIPKILISRHLVGVLEPRFPGPFHVIPQAVRAADYAPREPRDRPSETPRIGIVGPIEVEAVNKGVRVALAAAGLLLREGRPVRLFRANQMPLGDEERALGLSDRYDRYLHQASVKAMVDWYHALDLLIHPSFDAEGFPLPPLEAMASGVPVILTAIPSFDPIPRDAASWVPPGDHEAMAREAARLLYEPGLWMRRRERGLEVARSFSLSFVLDQLEAIFEGRGPAGRVDRGDTISNGY